MIQTEYNGSSTDDGYSTDGDADFWMKNRVTTKRELTKAEMDEYIQVLTQREEESEVDNML
jgi:hypothetical protein